MSIRVFADNEVYNSLKIKSFPAQSDYLAMYSSWLGGITTNPFFMQVPLDDHIVHRGDGIFEALKTVQGKVILFQEHWQRLVRSAQIVGLSLPLGFEDLKQICQSLYQFAQGADVLFRIFVSRGPGGFTTNPYESIGAQVYVVMTRFKPYSPEKYTTGATAKRSLTPVKEPWLAQAKTCNYLPNVMMRKEAIDNKVDFVIGFDEKQSVAESSTENIVIINKGHELVHPNLERILNGCTMRKVFELAPQAHLTPKIQAISESDLFSAEEILMVGTTIDILPITQYEGKNIGKDGVPGPFFHDLRARLKQSQLENLDFDLNLLK